MARLANELLGRAVTIYTSVPGSGARCCETPHGV
jgi:hypothetical protein